MGRAAAKGHGVVGVVHVVEVRDERRVRLVGDLEKPLLVESTEVCAVDDERCVQLMLMFVLSLCIVPPCGEVFPRIALYIGEAKKKKKADRKKRELSSLQLGGGFFIKAIST